ncbi:winged helix-turn-helix domain-containing protein [Tahibacter amnicola]|uniref:Winged helix-turn-helix domain-containing protein n=1 Tax=Tahibacter amnicola TaxID=2976241 RepID=A0ABY6BHW6_9GAMM|nr:winged helix-turn-helix domain-containing protein [Tahibacter amnicola]UXI69384.1 winged helix-turn-helix domain-containing protein [Tahibacter amnicola]
MNRTLRVAGKRIDVGALRLIDGDDTRRITPKALAVLLELAREPGHTRTRDELLLRVWHGRAGDGDVLTQVVKELRRLFDDDPTAPRVIETVPRVGYRLLAEPCWDLPAKVDPVPSAPPLRRRSTAGWVRLAGAIATGLILIMAAAYLLLRRMPAPAAMPLPLPVPATPQILTAEPGAEFAPHLSPDGSRVAYVAQDAETGLTRIYVRGTSAAATFTPTRGSATSARPYGRQMVPRLPSCATRTVPASL